MQLSIKPLPMASIAGAIVFFFGALAHFPFAKTMFGAVGMGCLYYYAVVKSQRQEKSQRNPLDVD
jgi:hypothetical protein